MITSQFNMTFASGQYYEMIDGVQRPCVIKQAYARAFGAFANYGLVLAVTGKKIRVISYSVSDFAAVALNYVVFETATVNMYPYVHVATNKEVIQGENSSGWFETLVSEALTVSSPLAGVDVFVRYIEYTPAP